jgi:hypothetical protein
VALRLTFDPQRSFDSIVDEALQEFAAERKASMPNAFS